MKSKEYISHKIHKLAQEGYTDPKQRVAIAYSMAKQKGYKVPDKKKKKGNFNKVSKYLE